MSRGKASANADNRRRFSLASLGPLDKVALAAVVVMLVAIIALNILQRCGLSLINGAVTLFLPFLALFVLVAWGASALVRRIGHRAVKIAVGCLAALVLLAVMMLGSTYISFVAAITVPQRYAVMAAPSGADRLVILRVLDADDARIEARRDARLAADPDGDPEITARDWGYVYRGYPQALGLFYRSDADVEGEVCLAYLEGTVPVDDAEHAPELPHGTLMLEWLDDGATAHLFVDSPGVAEGGECTVKFRTSGK